MDYDVAWSHRALADLEAAVRHGAADGPAAAEGLRQELLASVEVLARFPLIGPAYERDWTSRSREILCRRYRVFYRVDEGAKRVEVLTVWHNSRREPRLPR